MGAEIIGLDLSVSLESEQIDLIDKAFVSYKVLVFRDQDLTPEQLAAFSRHWGLVEEHIRPGAIRNGMAVVNILSNADAEGKPNGVHPDPSAMRWHTDRSYRSPPAVATLLYGRKVPLEGGDTLFANTTAAYDALSEPEKKRIDGLNVVHSLEFSRRGKGGAGFITPEELARSPSVQHPLARPHPVTGERAIYCGCHAWKVDGLDEAEGRVLLDRLVDHATEERFVYRHRWRRHDLVMWDNRCVFHAATPYDTAKELRVMYRTVVEEFPRHEPPGH